MTTDDKRAAHTPLTVEPHGHIRGAFNICDGDDPNPVATTERMEGASYYAVRLTDCYNALAGLNPEAVPDLVEALESFVDTIGRMEAGTMDNFGLTEDWRIARQALARVKGEG